MPYEIQWYIPQRVVLQRYYGILSVEDLRDGSHQLNEYLKEGIPLVHSLAHLQDVEKFPTNILEISRTIEPIGNDILGWTVAITDSRVIQFLSSAISQLFGSRFHSVNNLPDALAFLQRMDNKLNDLLPSSEDLQPKNNS